MHNVTLRFYCRNAQYARTTNPDRENGWEQHRVVNYQNAEKNSTSIVPSWMMWQ